MKLETRNFGEINIDEKDIIAFEEGLPGFPDYKRFVLLSEPENSIAFLQSADDGALSFVLVDMVSVTMDYNPHVDASAIENLGEYDPENFLIYNIATIYDDINNSTVNLKAPVVINAASKKGKQVVCEEEYPIKALLFAKENPYAREGGGAC